MTIDLWIQGLISPGVYSSYYLPLFCIFTVLFLQILQLHEGPFVTAEDNSLDRAKTYAEKKDFKT